MTLGVYPKVSLAQAHAEHSKARGLLEQGIDPGKVDQTEKSELRSAPTISMLVDEYMEKWAKPRKRAWEYDERILQKDVVPRWGDRKARDITRRDVIELLDEIVDRGAPIMANATFAVIRKMFIFAVGRSLLDTTPCVAIPAPAPKKRRDRVLSGDEVRIFWEKLNQVGIEENICLALKFQLVTAQRKGEIVKSEWVEFDFSEGWWTIPSERSKNGLPHRVPLSPQAIELLDRIKIVAGDSKWLFPSTRTKKHVLTTSVDHAIKKRHTKMGLSHFTPHDLRRTAATNMTSRGIPRLVVSKILNHVETGVTAVYDRHSYDGEKRQALELWGQRLDEIILGDLRKVG
jgi:integrase